VSRGDGEYGLARVQEKDSATFHAFETVSAVDGPNEWKGVGGDKPKLRLAQARKGQAYGLGLFFVGKVLGMGSSLQHVGVPARQPQDDVAVALARPSHRAKPIHHRVLKPDHALAPLVEVGFDGHAAEREGGGQIPA
jgi:hypothetical protein